MSGADFLLELRSEEIPARMQAAARAELEKLFRAQMAAAGLTVGELSVWSTPRRLALIAKDLPLATAAVSEELKGPRSSAPPQALEGFLRKTGLTQDQLEDRDGVYFAVINKPGRDTKAVLAEAIPGIIRAFAWPKSMRWGKASTSSESLRWVRPLSGIVALLGDESVECEIGGVASGQITRGHRFHSEGDIHISNAAEYAAKLREAYVIVDHVERQNIVRDGAAKVAADAGLTLVEDEGLVIENAGLTEWPVPLLGRFDDEFLAVPPEVIQLTARVNQKYFVVNDAAGKLANGFVCTNNIAATDGGKEIVAGNQKVLAARLSDARFFWEVDQKKPLAVHAEKLGNITFHEKLGSVADKVARVAKLAEYIAANGFVPNCDPEAAKQAALLSKADLVTEMVGEFPELQGVMGGYYARAEGQADAVANAVRDHYKPIGQADDVPTAPVTIAVSLADKLDTLCAFFLINEKPTGSKDPFALRRAGIAIVQLITINGLRMPISRVALEACFGVLGTIYRNEFEEKVEDVLGIAKHMDHPDNVLNLLNLAFPKNSPSANSGAAPVVIQRDRENAVKLVEIYSFLMDRLKVQQREAGVKHDLLDAVFSLVSTDDIVVLLARVKALQAFMATDDGANLLAGYKRAANILKQAGEVADAPSASAPTPADAALNAALEAAEPAAHAAVEGERFTDAMAALASLRAPIDAFFDGVMVNDPDVAVRAYRLGLLDRFKRAVHGVADFSKIEG
ncbi:glycine--tRNA ligase subunit beta [Sphingopyxis yananensis]|uniref:glycine--tRNA ligase subunit beta n=1 Tax=Sphingopyxis yananensis TaxID=2886687 RepID=UPI001D11D3E8|nr:glycine--tRNA ligase subunit beta [Sphingopyxis yananensis]MCC2603506.1 glycine--tRNA ligase subunit beta [Sphingopyxis yananensis]